MTEEQIKEQLSNRFIGILAANKGFAIDKPDLDLGVDEQLKKITDRNDKVSYLRAKSIGALTMKAKMIYEENMENFL